MDDHDRDAREPSAREEEAVRRLIETAGPRPLLPATELEAIADAARATWRETVATGDAPGSTESRSAPTPPGRRGRRPAARLVPALAALLLLALGLAWWWGRPEPGGALPMVARAEAVSGRVRLDAAGAPTKDLEAGLPVPAGALLRTGGPGGAGEAAAGRASLRLRSGAVVRLDRGTRLRLVSASILDLETGAVYVDTGSEGSGGEPLAVRTAAGTARDVGTRFAVRVGGPETDRLAVRVRDGMVEVERRGRTYRAGGGEELVLRPDGEVERRAVPAHGSGWQWMLEAAPAFDAEGRSVGELLDWVARETGWSVRFADPALAEAADEIVLQGSLAGVRPDQAPFAVLPAAGLEAELRDGVLLVRRVGGAGPTAPR